MAKYIKLFNTHAEYQQYMTQNEVLPNVSHCIEQNEVHYNPYVDPYNGYEYVDLGLPSGLKWAKCNVGAETETEGGLMFSWGSTTGYSNASEKNFQAPDYELGNGGYTAADMLKYNSTDGKTTLEPEDDAASVFMGGSWRMPTFDEFNEILDTNNVINTWVTNYNNSGVNGRLFTSKINGNTLFFPAPGSFSSGKLYGKNTNGYVWSSTVQPGINSANSLDFYSGGAGAYGNSRWFSKNVRGVLLA